MDSNNSNLKNPYDIYKEAQSEIDRIEGQLKYKAPQRSYRPAPFGESMPEHFTDNETHTIEILRLKQKEIIEQRDAALESHLGKKGIEKELYLKDFEQRYKKEQVKKFDKSQEYMYEQLEKQNPEKHLGSKQKDLDQSQEYLLSKIDKSKELNKEVHDNTESKVANLEKTEEGAAKDSLNIDQEMSFSDSKILQSAKSGIEKDNLEKQKDADKDVDPDKD